MEVALVQKTETGGKFKEIKTQKRSLDITVQNLGRVDQNDLVAKYWFFSKNVKTGDISVLVNGERKMAVPAGKKEVANSEQANANYVEAHFEGDGKGAGKKVEASGEKYYGYGVRLMDGDKVLQEVCNPQGLKDKLNTPPPAAKEPAKAPAAEPAKAPGAKGKAKEPAKVPAAK